MELPSSNLRIQVSRKVEGRGFQIPYIGVYKEVEYGINGGIQSEIGGFH
jgi:hypothetical protein